jgi:hypothetical protein
LSNNSEPDKPFGQQHLNTQAIISGFVLFNLDFVLTSGTVLSLGLYRHYTTKTAQQ